ncbi:hypothetical protein AMTR_s00020p00199840, partial [Amborella trichopoda]
QAHGGGCKCMAARSVALTPKEKQNKTTDTANMGAATWITATAGAAALTLMVYLSIYDLRIKGPEKGVLSEPIGAESNRVFVSTNCNEGNSQVM